MTALLATHRGAALPASVRRLTLVLVLSATADAFALVSLLWYLTVSHAGAAALGGLVLAAGVPAVVSGPLIGRWLERRPARWLLAADNLARAAVLLLVTALAAARVLTLPALFALAAVAGVLSPVTYAGSRVLLPRLVTEPDLVRANGMLAIGDQFPLLAAPALAGVAASLLGGTTALVIPAAALALAGWAAAGLPAAPPGNPAGGPAGADRDSGGLRRDSPPLHARQPNPALRAMLGLTGAYYFAYGPLEPAMPLYAHEVLHSGGTGYGALWSAFGLGALLGLLAVGRLARLRPGLVNAAGTALWGAATLPLVLVGALPAALLVMLAGGLIWGPYGAIETATIQRITPPRRHGTVFGIRRGIQVAATPAGAAAGGLLLTRLPPQAVIGLAAGSCVLVGVLGLLYPPLRRLAWPAS
jgi:MFS family permease